VHPNQLTSFHHSRSSDGSRRRSLPSASAVSICSFHEPCQKRPSISVKRDLVSVSKETSHTPKWRRRRAQRGAFACTRAACLSRVHCAQTVERRAQKVSTRSDTSRSDTSHPCVINQTKFSLVLDKLHTNCRSTFSKSQY